MMKDRDLPLSLLEFYEQSDLDGLYGKMSPEFFHLEKVETLRQSSKPLHRSGMAFHGECLTLNTSEFPKDVEESSLLGILEIGDHLTEFCLSPKACEGILKHAESREKTLPPKLLEALKKQVTSINKE